MITIGGMHVPCAPMWHDATDHQTTGWKTRQRTSPPDTIVLHWTAGEGSPAQVARTLGRRGLSVHFVIDGWGEVWQYEDPVHTVCLHAGGANQRSVGIEIVNYGWRPSHMTPPRQGQDRRMVTARVHGWTFPQAAFRPEQVTSALALCDRLTASISTIPRTVLRHSELADPSELTGGVIGHYHVSRSKIDPGSAILAEVAQHWGM